MLLLPKLNMKPKLLVMTIFVSLYLVAFAEEKQGFEIRNLGAYSELDFLLPPIVNSKDLLSYNCIDHSITVSKEAASRMREQPIGAKFAVMINGYIVYTGTFWSTIYSTSKDDLIICINTPASINKFKIMNGYPSSKFFTGVDQRSQWCIFDYLIRENKLKGEPPANVKPGYGVFRQNTVGKGRATIPDSNDPSKRKGP